MVLVTSWCSDVGHARVELRVIDVVEVRVGREIGLGTLQALQSIAVINGRPSVWGDAMLALVRGSGLCVYMHET
ncbi:MAG: hypothetical protein ACO3CU_12320, partial [Candidatus Nanopelagicales bacterium]